MRLVAEVWEGQLDSGVSQDRVPREQNCTSRLFCIFGRFAHSVEGNIRGGERVFT